MRNYGPVARLPVRGHLAVARCVCVYVVGGREERERERKEIVCTVNSLNSCQRFFCYSESYQSLSCITLKGLLAQLKTYFKWLLQGLWRYFHKSYKQFHNFDMLKEMSEVKHLPG